MWGASINVAVEHGRGAILAFWWQRRYIFLLGAADGVRAPVLLQFMICHSKKCHRPRTSSCHKVQQGGTEMAPHLYAESLDVISRPLDSSGHTQINIAASSWDAPVGMIVIVG